LSRTLLLQVSAASWQHSQPPKQQQLMVRMQVRVMLRPLERQGRLQEQLQGLRALGVL
jgi:hypothetical protein